MSDMVEPKRATYGRHWIPKDQQPPKKPAKVALFPVVDKRTQKLNKQGSEAKEKILAKYQKKTSTRTSPKGHMLWAHETFDAEQMARRFRFGEQVSPALVTEARMKAVMDPFPRVLGWKVNSQTDRRKSAINVTVRYNCLHQSGAPYEDMVPLWSLWELVSFGKALKQIGTKRTAKIPHAAELCTLRQDLGNVVLSEDGYFINGFLQSLQEDNRLITWTRPTRLPGGKPRPNSLLAQKYYEPGKPVSFRTLNARPVLLSQVMGAESGLQMGDEVEALKPGRFFKDTWIPSMWKKAKVVAVNYDGTYDLQFEMNHGPYREHRTKGLRGTPTLSLRRNEQFKEYAADHMPASFRLFQEMNYQLSVSPNNLRMPGMLDRIANMQDTDATQDWYLCSNKNFVITSSPRGRDAVRLDEYSRRFLFGYRWVPTADGDLRFEPVPNATQAQSLRACHKDTAMQFANAAQIDESDRRKISAYKAEMKHFEEIIGDLRAKPHQPRRPAGPRVKVN